MVDVAYSCPSNKWINRQVINQQINNYKQTRILIIETIQFWRLHCWDVDKIDPNWSQQIVDGFHRRWISSSNDSNRSLNIQAIDLGRNNPFKQYLNEFI